jgi:nucleoid-associated protein YgaU
VRSKHRTREHRAKRRAKHAPSPAIAPAAPVQTAAAPVEVQSTAPSVAAAPAAQVKRSPLRGRSYTVQPGDSLWSIASRVLAPGTSNGRAAREVSRLWELNKQRIGTGDPDLLKVGTVLRLR